MTGLMCISFIIGKMPNRLVILINILITAVAKAVPCLLSLCSSSLHAIFLLCLSIHKQTNKQCFPLPSGPLPAVLMSTSKGQNQPGHKETHQEAMPCSLCRQHLLLFFRMMARMSSAGRGLHSGNTRRIQSFS